MKAKTRHWFIYQQPCFRFHIFAIHLIGVRIMPVARRDVISSQRTSLQTLFQSTRPARGATHLSRTEQEDQHRISIHAPREGRDDTTITVSYTKKDFNPRAPRGARPFLVGDVFSSMIFQSTRPARGATNFCDIAAECLKHFNPRAPRGARPQP